MTPYIGAAVVGNDGAASSGQGAVIAGLSTLVSGAVAGALGQNVAGAATAAENESLHNCNLHECWKKVVDAWNSANNTATNAFDQLAFHMPDGVAQGLVAGANVPAMESATNLDLLKGIGNVGLNLSSFSLPGMPDYTPYFQYNNPVVGGIGETYGVFGVSRLVAGSLSSTAATNPTAGADSAANVVNGLNLNKSLASQEQLSQLMSGNGISVAGNGTNVTLRDAPRLVSEYGGQISDWSKVSSTSYTAADGSQFEIHAYRNAVTGQVVEPKSIPLR